MYIAGYDIGGTKCAAVIAKAQDGAGVSDAPGCIEFLGRYELPTVGTWNEIIDGLTAWIKQECTSDSITLDAAGVSCGGPLSPDRKYILSPPNLPGWDEVPITDYISDQLDVHTYMENDADACAIAEYMYGAGVGSTNMVFLTFGTGLGAGIILDGRLYRGSSGMAGEIGHIRMTEDGPVGYGKAGSLEGYASGGGIRQLAQGRSAKEVIMSARSGDDSSLEILRTTGMYLGRGLSILTDILNPDMIVIGSLFVRAEELIRPAMEEELRKECLGASATALTVRPAKLGEQIGDYGAICAALHQHITDKHR